MRWLRSKGFVSATSNKYVDNKTEFMVRSSAHFIIFHFRYFWLQARCSLGLRFSNMLRHIGCLLATDIMSRNFGCHLPTYAGKITNEQRPWIFSFIHSLGCLTTDPQPLPKKVLHRVLSTASSINFHYPLFSIRLSSSNLHLLPRLPVILSIPLPFLQ